MIDTTSFGFLNLMCRGGWFLHTINKKFSDTCWISTIQLNSDSIYLEITSDSTGGGLSRTRLTTITTTSHPGCYLYFFWLTDYKPEVHMTSCLSSINLLERPTEHHLFVIKGHNIGTAKWKRCIRKVGGKGRSFKALGHAVFSQVSPCSPTRKLSEPHPFGFLWRLHYKDMLLNHWPLVIELNL